MEPSFGYAELSSRNISKKGKKTFTKNVFFANFLFGSGLSQAEGSVQAILGQLGSRLGNVVGCVALRGSFGREKLPFVEFFLGSFWNYVGPYVGRMLGLCWLIWGSVGGVQG